VACRMKEKDLYLDAAVRDLLSLIPDNYCMVVITWGGRLPAPQLGVSGKSRMRAPLHWRTEKIGACLADPFANGEGAQRSDTFTIPKNGAGGGCIDPAIELRATAPTVNGNDGPAR
jgi:hypothetical protein